MKKAKNKRVYALSFPYMEFKNRQNQMILIKVRPVSSSGLGQSCRELEMFYILIWVAYMTL